LEAKRNKKLRPFRRQNERKYPEKKQFCTTKKDEIACGTGAANATAPASKTFRKKDPQRIPCGSSQLPKERGERRLYCPQRHARKTGCTAVRGFRQ
jgi:hypothetical protein